MMNPLRSALAAPVVALLLCLAAAPVRAQATIAAMGSVVQSVPSPGAAGIDLAPELQSPGGTSLQITASGPALWTVQISKPANEIPISVRWSNPMGTGSITAIVPAGTFVPVGTTPTALFEGTGDFTSIQVDYRWTGLTVTRYAADIYPASVIYDISP